MYRVKLSDFEGPLDLLLFFIRRDELDIYDIPIAGITDEYLQYVRLMREVNLDTAGEFIYMAAVLMGIKAKMLLPRPELDEAGDPIDPRRELVERLLAYIRYKEASGHLSDFEAERHLRFTRGENIHLEFEENVEISYQVSIFGLMSALKNILSKVEETPILHQVQAEDYSIEAQETYILDALRNVPSIGFIELVKQKSKPFVITTFLAILEMIRNQQIFVLVTAVADDFTLSPTPFSVIA